MPIYEYYCHDCNAIFEQLRPVSRAGVPEPCPECDQDAQRLMPTAFQAFVVRDGAPRRIPDRGKFWHYGQEVDRPVNETVQLNEHPDLIYQRYGPDAPPTAEEQDRYAEKMVARLEYEEQSLSAGQVPTDLPVQRQQMQQFVDRVRKTAPVAKAMRKKRPNAEVTPKTRSGKHQPPRPRSSAT